MNDTFSVVHAVITMGTAAAADRTLKGGRWVYSIRLWCKRRNIKLITLQTVTISSVQLHYLSFIHAVGLRTIPRCTFPRISVPRRTLWRQARQLWPVAVWGGLAPHHFGGNHG